MTKSVSEAEKPPTRATIQCAHSTDTTCLNPNEPAFAQGDQRYYRLNGNVDYFIVAGERDPQTLAALNSRIRSSHDEIAKALSGNYRAELVFVLQQELTLYDLHQQQIAA